MRRLTAAALLGLSLGLPRAGLAEETSRGDLFGRLDRYLRAYERQLASVVAEEHYEQWTEGRAAPDAAGDPAAAAYRTLTSDFGFLRLPGRPEWLGLRDTFLVDGRPVRPRDARLERLLADGSPAALDRLRHDIVEQNARYNIGDVIRTINVPMLALDLLGSRHRSGFRVRQRGKTQIDGRAVQIVEFDERERPTAVRSPQGNDRPAHGTAWIDPAAGAVLRTELRLGDERRSDALVATFAVRYQHDPDVDLLVPVEMRERYDLADRASGPAVIHAVATYTSFRRFRTAGRILPGESRAR